MSRFSTSFGAIAVRVAGLLICASLAIGAGSPVRASSTREPTAAELVLLGRLMFFDPSLSASGRLACGTCHDPRYAYGPPPGQGIGRGGADMTRSGTRAVPSLRYLHQAPAFKEQYRFVDGDVGPMGGLTWDGRAKGLREQAEIPLLAPNEMANSGPADVARRLRNTAYAAQIRAAFGAAVFDDPKDAYAAGLRALEAFQQVPEEFFPYTSRYDAFLRGELELTAQEEHGVQLFKDPAKGNCASCHLGVSRAGTPPRFTDFDFVNVGVPRNPRLAANADPAYYDLGLCGPLRQDFAARREYCGFFRSPTLRNVATRDVYFHNGVFTSLREVLHFYNERDLHPEKFYPHNADGSVHPFDDLPAGYPDNVDHDPPLDRKPGAEPALSEQEIDDLLAFLDTLTDGYVAGGVPDPTQAATPVDWQTRWREPSDRAAAASHSDEYAWRLFVALNWPADPQRRAADATAALGAERPVVWETWQTAAQVYLADGADPGPWQTEQPSLTAERRFETEALAATPRVRHIVAGVMVDGLPLENARRLTEIRMNRTAFDYIRGRELYNVEGQLHAVAQPQGVSFPYGSKEIKATWRPIDAREQDRYYTTWVTFRDGSHRLYGLTGLHIVSKDLPQWFWATFEHVDNPTLEGNEGWQLPSRDRFACPSAALDCNRAPASIGLENGVWRYYRLRGTQTQFEDVERQPQLLANSELESGFQTTASCVTCHARSALGLSAGGPARLPIFDPARGAQGTDAQARRGFTGRPSAQWFATGGSVRLTPLDFVWSLSNAKSKRSDARLAPHPFDSSL